LKERTVAGEVVPSSLDVDVGSGLPNVTGGLMDRENRLAA
jgi:hypothetical protein